VSIANLDHLAAITDRLTRSGFRHASRVVGKGTRDRGVTYRFKHHGIECGSGWKPLYMPLIGRCMNEDATILEVRSVNGVLSIKAEGGSQALHDALREAEQQSKALCESCGETDCQETGPCFERANKRALYDAAFGADDA
jgi:hypothetical protein